MADKLTLLLETETVDYYCPDSGALLVTIPTEAILDCSHQGACDDDVAYWSPRVQWVGDRAALAGSLDGYGAWDDLDTAEEDTLRQRVLWLACCDMRENPEHYIG